jgi:hypothetical protein
MLYKRLSSDCEHVSTISGQVTKVFYVVCLNYVESVANGASVLKILERTRKAQRGRETGNAQRIRAPTPLLGLLGLDRLLFALAICLFDQAEVGTKKFFASAI